MKKLLVVIILLAVSASVITYCVNNYREEAIEQKAKLQAAAEEKAAAEKANVIARKYIQNMVDKYSAIDNWTEKIKDKERILSLELEQLWTTNRPILFVGTIRDISTADNRNYQIRIYGKTKAVLDGPMLHNRGPVNIINHYGVKTILRLTLNCRKELIDTLVKEKPDILSGKNIVVAVIASIKKIKSVDYITTDNEVKSGNLGIGECLDMFFIGSYPSFFL